MDRGLMEAAQKGDIDKLYFLIKSDPLMLKFIALSSGDTPLHIACVGGHVNFVKEVLNLCPEQATDLNQYGLSPLHIASANGDVEIMKELLKVGSNDLCLVKGIEERVPLHSAVVKGRKEAAQVLLSSCLNSINESTVRGESCFHLAVKNNQFQILKILVDHAIFHKNIDILNKKDEQGNSILHLAAFRKQYEAVKLLLVDIKASIMNSGCGTLEVQSVNKRGLIPIDVLASEGGDCEIEEMFRLEMNSFPQQTVVMDTPQSREQEQSNCSKWPFKKLQDYFKYDKIKDSPIQVRNTLLVLAVLIAAATYQPVLSPPGVVWQDDLVPGNSTGSSSIKKHAAGMSVMGTNNAVSYGLFLFFNSVGFFMSLHMLNFLTIGLPLQFELRVSLFALTATYDTCMIAISPRGKVSSFFLVLSFVMPITIPLMAKLVRDHGKLRQYVLPRRIGSV